MLHHPGYRKKFADNLKRELPHLRFAPDFGFRYGGQTAVQPPPGLRKAEAISVQVGRDARRTTLQPGGRQDAAEQRQESLRVNPSLTLGGIPSEVFRYRLGNLVPWSG